MQSIIERKTAVLPYVIADRIIAEVENYVGAEIPNREAHIDSLCRKADRLYTAKRKPIYTRSDTKLRNTLYVFMRHWLAAALSIRNTKINGIQLPMTFANGEALTK